MNLHELYAELRDEERSRVPAFAVAPASRRLTWPRLAAAFVVLLLIIFLITKPRSAFTPEDRAAARAIAAWHPPTDTLLRMPTTGVAR